MKHWLTLLAPFQLLLPAQSHLCAAAEVVWKTGAEFDEELESRVGVRWSSNPLRAALTNLARNQDLAIFLDRRVDPDQTVDLVIADTPLRELLQRLADQLKLGVGQVGPAIYLGPPSTAAVVGTVAALKEEQEQRLPSAVRSRLRRTQPLRWPELTTPRDLIQRLAGEAGLQVAGLEQIPHDLWPEVDLPPLTFAQSLSLILAGFELTFDYAPDGASVQLIALAVQGVHHTPDSAARQPRGGRRRNPAAIPRGAVHDRSRQRCRRFDGRSRGCDPAAHRGRIVSSSTLTRQGQGGETLHASSKQVAWAPWPLPSQKKRALNFVSLPEPRTLRDKLVSLEVKDVTLDQLLRTLLESSGLTYRLDEQTLEIRTAGSP